MSEYASLRITSPTPTRPPHKISVGKQRGRTDPATIKAWLSPKSSRTMAEVRRSYGRLLDNEVSTSLIVRRALALLQDHLDDLHSRADAERELGALMSQVR